MLGRTGSSCSGTMRAHSWQRRAGITIATVKPSPPGRMNPFAIDFIDIAGREAEQEPIQPCGWRLPSSRPASSQWTGK